MLPTSPSKLDLANLPTEFRPLERISKALGGPKIWLKCDDQTGSVVSGNKIRKLEFLAAQALAEGCDTLITCGGLQSNHCRATAAVAARLGMRCHLILRGPRGMPVANSEDRFEGLDFTADLGKQYQGNLLLDDLCGAQVSIYPAPFYGSNLSEIFEKVAEQYHQQGNKTYAIPTGGSNGLGLWGYIGAARELVEDFAKASISPEAIICASGSGGTQGGLTLGLSLLGVSTPVIGMAVCDSVAYFDHKVREDVAQWQEQFLPEKKSLAADLSVHTIDDYIGPGYALPYPELLACIRLLGRLEGVILDPVYTGKAFYGLVQKIKAGHFKEGQDVVFVHTGGTYGVFPFSEELYPNVNK